jgi:ERCC4-type nuclease
MRTSWTIIVDTREKRPLPFPDHLVVMDHRSPADDPKLTTVSLNLKHDTLRTGDYVLEGFEKAGVIERKKDLLELNGNLCSGTGRVRFLKELDRFKDFASPAILLEVSAPVKAPSNFQNFKPSAVRDMLLMVCVSRNIPLMTFNATSSSGRRMSAEWAASFLIQAAIRFEAFGPPAPEKPLETKP